MTEKLKCPHDEELDGTPGACPAYSQADRELTVQKRVVMAKRKAPKTKWPQATKEMLKGDTRTVEEGKGCFWLLVEGLVSKYREFCIFDHIEKDRAYFRYLDHNLPCGHALKDIKIQPAPAPPEMDKD